MTTIHSIVDEGLGNSSYLVDIGDGRALVVDPSRNPTAYLRLAEANGLNVAYAAETHLHADFVSGSRELSAHGARVIASSLGHLEFSHLGVRDGEEVDLGGLTLRALATPGHTPEHVSYLLLDGSRSIALFTGGSLLVGAVARTDLVDPDRGEHYARMLYRSLRDKMHDLPDELSVYPTHGAGSFCSAPTGGERTTTLGRERSANPFLAAHDEDTFAALLLAGLGSYPPYFLRLQDVNRVGPHVYGGSLELPRIAPEAVRKLVADGAVIIDVRPVPDYAARHIPGSLSIALRPAFATWLGWVAPVDVPLVFVANDDQDRGDLVRQALKIGYERIAGELEGSVEGWHAAGLEVRRTGLVDAVQIPGSPVIDVRQASEFAAGHLPGARHVELGQLASENGLPDGPLVLMCGHGERAATGASMLERAGRSELTVVKGGPEQWASVAEHQLETG